MLFENHIPEAEFERFRHLIPGPEPTLMPRATELDNVRRIIPVADLKLDGNELRYLTECIETNWISSIGPFVREFEESFANAVGCEFGIACSSGTAALHLALAALGLGPGDEVIIPTFTMIATANAISYTGATPVLVDAEPDTWNINVAQLAARITSNTKAIVVVHTYGHPAAMDAIRDLAQRHRLHIVEDAAEAHGAEYRGRRVGSLGDVATFSFYANKLITTGEGGMVTTSNPELARIMRRLRDHAFSDERHFWHRYRGFNYRMTNLQAAIGLAQTERLDALIAQRRHNAQRYRELLSEIGGLRQPVERPEVKNVFWMYCLLVEPEYGCSRDELRARLAASGIETRTFFIPMHFQPCWFATFRGERYPVAERLCEQGLYLPSGPALTEEEICYVAGAIARIR